VIDVLRKLEPEISHPESAKLRQAAISKVLQCRVSFRNFFSVRMQNLVKMS